MGRKRLIIGIDEVGRGALCGGVTVAAFAFLQPREFFSRHTKTSLRDSKRLTPRAREKWFADLKKSSGRGEVVFAVAHISPRTVDRMNIRNATNLAATRAYERLVIRKALSPLMLTVLLDGGLSIDPPPKIAPHRVRTIVRGDERIHEIQLASIVAKVTRDRAMTRLHVKHSAYGFAAHKGYGTRVHRNALKRFGPIEGLHRLTFLKKFLKVSTV